MSYPMFKVHIDKDAAIQILNSVLDSGFLNEGAQVQDFLEGLRKFHNFNNIVLTNSCTSALTMALKLAGVDHGSEVITTSMTCVASNTPIMNLGAKPVWADIDPQTGNIDPKSVASLITDKTRAVICVNWAGMPCDLSQLHEICKNNNIKLIQDAAHAFGAMYKGKDVSNFADYTCYSYQAIKHITCGDGGSIFCLNDDDYEKAKKMKWFGLDRDATKDKNGEWKGQRWEADIEDAGYKFNMNNIAAAIGLSQFNHVDRILSSHRDNALRYRTHFSKTTSIKPLIYDNDSNPSFWVYTVLLEKGNRDLIIKNLNEKGIGAGLVHVPNHDYSCFKNIRVTDVHLPGVDKFHECQVSLPCGWWLNKDDIDFIANELITLVE